MTCRAPRCAVTALFALGLALLAATAVFAAQTWAQRPVLTPVETLLETRMNDGALRLLFQDVAGGRVREAVSSDAGGTWVFREVSDGDAATASFDLTFDASNQTLTHVAYAGDGLVYARAAGSATVWRRTTLDATPGAGATGIAVATQAATVAVLYRKDGALWLIRSPDNGATWGTAKRVADAAAGLLALEIDAPGALHALYPLPDGSGPVYALSADGGATWVETTISDKTDLSGSRQLMVLDGQLLVAAFGSATGVHVARSSDAGASWTLQKLSDGSGASLVLDRSGTFHLAGRGEDGKSVKVFNSVDAHSWNRETIESAPDSDPRDVVIAVSGEAVFVPFVQFEADLVAAWNGGAPAPLAPVDITGDASESDAELRAWLESQWYDPDADDWYFRYAYYYRNGGNLAATNVAITCLAPLGSETVDTASWLPIPGMREPERMTFNPGFLSKFEDGRTWLTVRLPGDTAPGTELLMHAELSNDNTENDTGDNMVDVAHAVPLIAPLVSSPPLGGQTCRTGVLVGGSAQPGTTVVLLRDGEPAGSDDVGSDRTFAFTQAGLGPGDHLFSTTAQLGESASPVQEFVWTVDTALAADPVAIVLVDAQGRVQHLNDGAGRAMLASGWRSLRLAPGQEYTLGISSCCPTDPALQEWMVTLEGGGAAGLPLTYDAATGSFQAAVTVPAGTAPGTRLPVTVQYRCAPTEPLGVLVATGVENGALVAAGRVYDTAEGKGIDDPVAGIVSTLWAGRPATGLGGIPAIAWVPWPAELFGAAPNPQVTGAGRARALLSAARTLQLGRRRSARRLRGLRHALAGRRRRLARPGCPAVGQRDAHAPDRPLERARLRAAEHLRGRGRGMGQRRRPPAPGLLADRPGARDGGLGLGRHPAGRPLPQGLRPAGGLPVARRRGRR